MLLLVLLSSYLLSMVLYVIVCAVLGVADVVDVCVVVVGVGVVSV